MAKIVSQLSAEPGVDMYWSSWVVFDAPGQTVDQMEDTLQGVSITNDPFDDPDAVVSELRQKLSPLGWTVEGATYAFLEF